MAKKKAKPLEREERPEFLAMLASLPDDIEAMHARAARLRAIYNDAIIAGDEAARAAATLEHDAIVFKLNGGTFFGCRGDDTRPGRVLDAQHVAKPGQVPHWGQDGEFLVEVDGVRVLVKYECQGLRSAPGFDARAVDFDKPFFSRTGYQGVYLTVTDHMGRTLEQAVRAEIAAQIAAEGLKPIKEEDLRWIEKRPAWLVDVLAGVTRDGQLAMFGDQPEQKKPLSGAQRQKRRREKLKKLKEEQGLREVRLTLADLQYLWWAVDVFATVRADLGHLGSPVVRESLTRIFKSAPWFESGGLDQLGSDPAVKVDEARREKELARAWEYARKLERELNEKREANHKLSQHYKASTLRAVEDENALLVVERDKAFKAVEVLQQRLRAAGLSTDWRE